MDVRVVRVPVIDGDPLEPRAEVPFHVGHELAREGLEVADLGRVLGRDDEAEMMPVVLAALRERALISLVSRSIEHPRRLAVSRDTFALEIGDVLGQRSGTEARALVAHDTRLGHNAPGVRAQPDRDRSAPAAAEPRAAPALARPETAADMARLLRGTHYLADEGLRTLAAAIAVLDAPGPDA